MRVIILWEVNNLSIVLSLQGCMAVGKTTAVKYIQENAPYVNISYEFNTNIIEQIKLRGLNKNIFEDYIEIQKLWISKEIERYELAKGFECSVMDFGAEEIEFYTLNYPKTIGADWNVKEKLYPELQQLKDCMPDRILFLDASEQILRIRKENDQSCSRQFFEYHLQHLLPLKKSWFIGRSNVDVLEVNSLTKEEVGQKVKVWVDNCIHCFSK
ncbi:MAG: hypothetical protein K0R23_2479 [Lacrimispora sp.]|nr:hypothetical protein [Lacrimispora sp.]